MNKTELIDAMASKTGMTKKNAEAALDRRDNEDRCIQGS